MISFLESIETQRVYMHLFIFNLFPTKTRTTAVGIIWQCRRGGGGQHRASVQQHHHSHDELSRHVGGLRQYFVLQELHQLTVDYHGIVLIVVVHQFVAFQHSGRWGQAAHIKKNQNKRIRYE